MSSDHYPAERRTPPSSMVRLFVIALFVGFAEYAAVAALADVAKHFGHVTTSTTVASVIGLSGSVLGVGLAVLRVASLGALPLTSVADAWGRRRVLRATATIGLMLAAIASLSPSYWFFVLCFALGRPFLAAALTLLQIVTVEVSSTAQRVQRLALLAAGSGGGSGVAAVAHGLIRGDSGFRWLFALTLVPLLVVPWLVRGLPETGVVTPRRRVGAVPADQRAVLWRVAVLFGVVNVIAGPANGFLFVYGESFLHIAPGRLASLVVLSALTGLLGLVASHVATRWWSRAHSVAYGVAGTSGAAMLAYSGGSAHFVAGYLAGVFMGGFLTPALNALGVESFAPSVRATAGGWLVVATVVGATVGLVAFGVLADVTHAAATSSALRLPALFTFLPLAPLGLVAWRVRPADYDDSTVRSA